MHRYAWVRDSGLLFFLIVIALTVLGSVVTVADHMYTVTHFLQGGPD